MKKFFFIFLFISYSFLSAKPDVPVLPKYANDFTGTLSESELDYLNSILKSFNDSTSTQIVLLVISSLDDYPMETFTYEVADKNKIGSEKNNNGILFFVAKDDRKMRIEVGYGLEGALPDALTNSILRNEVAPYFKQNEYYAGIAAGINSIIAASRGEYQDKTEEDDNIGFIGILPIIFFIVIFILVGRNRTYYIGGGGGSVGSSGFGSFGGFSSGGGSSFGGGGFSGGGGSFGGGGSSGSW